MVLGDGNVYDKASNAEFSDFPRENVSIFSVNFKDIYV